MDPQTNDLLRKTKQKRKKQINKKKNTSVVQTSGVASESAKKTRRNYASTVLIALIALAVAGASVFVWQKEYAERKIEQTKKEADGIKIDFENRMSELKDKLAGIEIENNELKTENQELAVKTELLNSAKMKFTEPRLGISFEYPAIFGEVKLEIIEDNGNKFFKGKLAGNEKLVFGGVADNFKTGASTTAEFLNTTGFSKKKGKYFYKSTGVEYEIQPLNIVKLPSGSEGLVVDKKSFAQKELSVDLGENIGALVNLNSSDFEGIGFINQDISLLPLIDFAAMIESVEISNK